MTSSVKKMANAATKTLLRHNAFLLAASEDNNYDLDKFYDQAKKEMEMDEEQEEQETEHVVFNCKFNLFEIF